MKKLFKQRLDNTSKMLLHFVQEVRRAVKKDEEMAALRAARDALNMASWVIAYGSAIATIKHGNGKEQK